MTDGDSVLVLIDTDPGIDDALALLYAWGSPECRLAGLTTVAGNVEVADATRNLFRLLALRRPATAEFNFHVDPEAAAQVLDAGLPIDLVALDATRQALLPRADLEAALARRPGPFATRCAAFTLRGFSMDAARGTPGMALHDPL